jgi:hypothetical protein
MLTRLTDKACKAIIIQIAKELDVEARLITTRLMSEDDKNDMRNGNLPRESLKLHVQIWKKSGYPDYAHGKTVALRYEQENSPVS